MFHRRDILKAALTAAAVPAFKLPAFAAPPRRFIDIHCHFFNAADLPIRGFLQRVVMADYNAGQRRPPRFRRVYGKVWPRNRRCDFEI